MRYGEDGPATPRVTLDARFARAPVAAAAVPCYWTLVDSDAPPTAERFAARLARAALAPAAFRAALSAQPSIERDGWLDRVPGLGELLDDGPALPRGDGPYLPCAVGVLLDMVDAAPIGPSDVFVDIGAGGGGDRDPARARRRG